MRKADRAVVLAAGFLGLSALFSVAADATGTTHEGYDTAYAGSGWQYGWWSQSQGKVRLQSNPYNGMSSSRCMDAMVDWKVKQPIIGHHHYDSRVIRSCLPGTAEETDPGGDNRWSEPSDWGGETPQGLQRGFGYIIDDSTLDILSKERFANSGSVDVTNAPSTFGQGGARVRTRYNNGTVGSCNPLPVNDATYHGCS